MEESRTGGRRLARISRRVALALFGGGAASLAYRRQRRRRSPVLQRIQTRAPAQGLEVARLVASAPALRFFALGDIGWDSHERSCVVAEMARQAASFAPRSVLLLGDNFYPSGLGSSDDSRWQSDFELLFPSASFPVPFRACLGNHDHMQNPDAQVEYTRHSPRWSLPARYYTFEESIPGEEPVPAAGTAAPRHAQFFVLDTEACWNEQAAFEAQLAWLEHELARSKAHWKLVVGHHCIRSGGEHGPINELACELEPILRRHGVDLYLSGHDHDLQLLRGDGGWLQLVSGSGSSVRPTGWTAESLFAAATPGFAALELTGSELRIHLCEAGRGPTFSHVVKKEPVLVASLMR